MRFRRSNAQTSDCIRHLPRPLLRFCSSPSPTSDKKTMLLAPTATRSIPADLRMTVIDVGAFGGVARPWASIGGVVDAIAFEPSPGECHRLNALGCRFVRSIQFYPH